MERRSDRDQLRLANAYLREAITCVRYHQHCWASWCLNRAAACLVAVV